MKIAVIQFPGSNCERETTLAIKRAEMAAVPFLWNESPEKLSSCDGYVIVGGFSYEDRGRAGIIAALDPIMQVLKTESEKGKPILGICNGAQILVEAGLVPGLENNKVALALTENKRVVNNKILGTGYYNAWVHIRLPAHYQRNAFTKHLTATQVMRVPIAHAEGRFVVSEGLWQEINEQGLAVFQYCDEAGVCVDAFPVNPNGSFQNIAAISNKAGNVLAMMPHPERTLDGDKIFQSMRDYIASGHVEKVEPLYYYPRKTKLLAYQQKTSAHQWIVELFITDNQALTVQQTLNRLGFSVTVKRYVHWELECAADSLQQLKASGVLYNDRKEREVSVNPVDNNTAMYLVRAHDDLLGEEKKQILQDHFHLEGIAAIRHSVLWHFSSVNGDIKDQMDAILNTNLISNRCSHDCLLYS